MKSTDVRNWEYELSYSEIAQLEDFTELLNIAICSDLCIFCRSVSHKVYGDGLCIECRFNLTGKDRKISTYVLAHPDVRSTGITPEILENIVKGNKTRHNKLKSTK